jgi:S1-C subfamily serine protease
VPESLESLPGRLGRPFPLVTVGTGAALVALVLAAAVVGCGGETSVFTADALAEAATSTTLLQASLASVLTPSAGVVLNDVSDLVKAVRPGVVSVIESGLSMDMFRQQVETEGQGTGIVIDAEGRILINYHVICGADAVSVYAEDGRERSARVLFGDPATDIAILEVEDTEDLVPLVLGDSDAMEVGDPVIARATLSGSTRLPPRCRWVSSPPSAAP